MTANHHKAETAATSQVPDRHPFSRVTRAQTPSVKPTSSPVQQSPVSSPRPQSRTLSPSRVFCIFKNNHEGNCRA
ncbi:hypothetical protein L1887_34930 [Cichorium endivia]|nr:hypothetical protein L1887_34930 [Cichorium endivia]